MSSDLGVLHPALVPVARWFCQAARDVGYQVQVTSTLRSAKKQEELYDEWLLGKRDLPVLPPGRSLHEKGLAWDMVVDNDYRGVGQADVGAAWQSLGGVWGGVADPVHFQPPRWWWSSLT